MTLSEIKRAIHAILQGSRDAAPYEHERAKSELAEILLYVIQLANRHGIDLADEADKKIAAAAKTAPQLVFPPDGTDPDRS